MWIVTGDNIRTANSLGTSLGIPSSYIISEALPSTKIRHVQSLQAEGEFVGFVGDGINDAPAGACITLLTKFCDHGIHLYMWVMLRSLGCHCSCSGE